MVQMVERLPSQCEALNPKIQTPVPQKKKKKEIQRKAGNSLQLQSWLPGTEKKLKPQTLCKSWRNRMLVLATGERVVQALNPVHEFGVTTSPPAWQASYWRRNPFTLHLLEC
jgi:hypothetical protein